MKCRVVLFAMIMFTGCCILPARLSAQTQTVRCKSDDMGRHTCPADTRGGVRLSRQISGSPCTLGTTWGFDNGGIWVDKGCRADFEVSAPAAQAPEPQAQVAGAAPVGQNTGPCGSGLVGQLSQGLNITPEQARAGAGELFALARSRLAARDFSQVSSAVPEMDDLLRAAPETRQLSAFGGWTTALAALQKLGLSPGTVMKFVPVLVNYVRCRGGSNAASLLGKTLQ